MRQVIVERVLILAPDRQVTAGIGLPLTPADHPLESWCPWQIEGLGSGGCAHRSALIRCRRCRWQC
jgi:hypothetical protein